MQNCRVEMIDGKLVITIIDINAELGLNRGGRSMRVAFGNISYLDISGTLNVYRSLKRGGHYENLDWRIVGNSLQLSVIDMGYDGGPTPKGHRRLAHGAETIDGDMTVQLTLWRERRRMW